MIRVGIWPEGFPPKLQRLSFKGQELEDEETLASCKIQDGDTIHCTVPIEVARAFNAQAVEVQEFINLAVGCY